MRLGSPLKNHTCEHGRRQFDVAEPLATDFRERNFDAALVADHAAVLHALVLAAQALPVGDRAEDAGAEQAIALRLEGAVVDGLRLGHLTVRPAADLFRRSQADADGVKVGDRISELKWIRTEQIVLLSCGLRRSELQDPTAFARPLAAPVRIISPGAASCGSSGGSYLDPQRSVGGDRSFQQRLVVVGS